MPEGTQPPTILQRIVLGAVTAVALIAGLVWGIVREATNHYYALGFPPERHCTYFGRDAVECDPMAVRRASTKPGHFPN